MKAPVKMFSGIHEVRLMRPAGIAVGYFDDWGAALRAVEDEPTQYKAAYFTLNPIDLPNDIPLNPTSLRATANAVSNSDVLKRVWLLVDLDPPRPPSTNSTDDEKQAARGQAERLREHLRTKGWPEPIFCNSGNGWHLLYRIDIANDDAGTEVIRGVLSRLHQLFPMVDTGNFDACRVTKLYGSFTRKGTHCESRPWRRSSIVETPETLNAVAPSLLQQLANENTQASRPIVPNDAKLARLIGFLDHYEIGIRSEPRHVKNGWAIGIVCPWADEHSGESNRDTEVSFIPGVGNGFKCFHGHCAERNWHVLRAEMEARNPTLPKYFGKRNLPRLVHSEIASSFVEQNDDFVCIYDAGAVTGCWVGTRWSVGDDKDYLLRRALRDYLDSLFPLYPEPDEGKYDPRNSLLQSPFLSNVLNEVRPLLPKKSIQEFDADPWLLAVPAGQVIELNTGQIRPIRREDCITQRIDISPIAGLTPRFDTFMLEIAGGDIDLAAYIRRLCGLCLSGHAEQILVFFWGRGRNGKGVLLRLISKILGPYAVVLRPNELTYTRDDGDRMKRTIAKIIGKRLVTVNEAVGQHLNFAMLKTLSGGDRISGAKMRQDDREADATHKLILPSNDRPTLPADPAMRGRLHFVPFLGDFSGEKGDRFIEEKLWCEREGILYKLVQHCADVKLNGLRPPVAVTQATAELMDENDLTAQFISDCVVKSDTFTSKQNVEAAIRHWLPGMVVGADKRVDGIIGDLKMKFEWGKRREGGKPLWGFTGLALERSGS